MTREQIEALEDQIASTELAIRNSVATDNAIAELENLKDDLAVEKALESTS